MDRRDFLKSAAEIPAATVTPAIQTQQEASTIDRSGEPDFYTYLKSVPAGPAAKDIPLLSG